ncbi:hypothetical protein HanOQP8_Chr05g0181561 [Helianthus annuus]|nr:hypothetical protein HanOQP8_Chr05g0181561 [Helianthus annuus]
MRLFYILVADASLNLNKQVQFVLRFWLLIEEETNMRLGICLLQLEQRFHMIRESADATCRILLVGF